MAFRLLIALPSGVGLWCSLGVVARLHQGEASTMAGLLPPIWWLPILVSAVLLIAIRTRITVGLLALPIVTIAPWTGIAHPAMSIWTGACALLPWLLAAAGAIRMRVRAAPEVARSRPATILAVALLALGTFWWSVRSVGTTGDEPHYLLMSTSMVTDGDLALGNDYSENRHLSFYPGPLTPRHTVLSPNGREYSFHSPGIALLTLPGFFVAGVHGARALLLIISALGVLLAWAAAREMTGTDRAAAIAPAMLLVATPFLAQSTAIYPDGTAAAIVSLATWTMLRLERRAVISASWLAATGAALAALPWLHLRLSLVAAVFGLALLWVLRRTAEPLSNALVFLAAPVIGAVLLIASTWVMFETWDPTAPLRQVIRGSWRSVPRGTLGLLTDHEYGLLIYAPAFAVGMAGTKRFLQAAPVTASASLTATAATLIMAASYMWWGGTTSPARFLVPILPLLAIATAVWWRHASEPARSMATVLLTLTATIGLWIAAADGGRFMINAADGRGSIFEWSNAVVDLPAALPSLFRPDSSAAAEAITVLTWVITAAIVFGIAAVASRRFGGAPESWAAWAVIVWIMTAASIAWSTRAVDAWHRDRSQLTLLQHSSRPWLSTGFAGPLEFTSRRNVLTRIAAAAPTEDPHWRLVAPRIPPGRYRIAMSEPAGTGSHTYALSIGRDAWPIRSWRSGEAPPEFALALPVHSVRVSTSDPSLMSPPTVRLEVLDAGPAAALPMAERVTRYGALDVYSLDSASVMEVEGFWIPGERETAVALGGPSRTVPPTVVTIDAAADALLRIRTANWSDERQLRAGGRTAVRLPQQEEPLLLHIMAIGTQSRQALWVTVHPDADLRQ